MEPLNSLFLYARNPCGDKSKTGPVTVLAMVKQGAIKANTAL